MTGHKVEYPIEIAHGVQPVLSLRGIGAAVAARGKSTFQPLPRSPAMSHPTGGISDEKLSVTALPRPIVVLPYG